MRCFSANVRISWRWTAIKSVLRRESEDTGEVCPFETEYHKISGIIQMEKYLTLYQCARECNDFDSFVKAVA